MYTGWLAINGEEVVNTHRVTSYAKKAGLAWATPCAECSSIDVAIGGPYITPFKDVVKPPWWGDGSNRDAEDFLGLMGLTIQNADDSTRKTPTTEGISDGGYIGATRYTLRTITVRALAIATTDCALGFGLEWMRGLDGGESCDTSVVELYDCCPNLAAADCTDPACIDACVQTRLRLFYEARVTEGPTVLNRREMYGGGAMAEVEFVIVAGDPFIYSFVPAAQADVPMSVAVVDPPADDAEEMVDLFAAPVDYMLPPSLVRTPKVSLRSDWQRQTVPLIPPAYGGNVVPIIALEPAGGDVSEVRVTLRRNGSDAASFLVPRLPVGGRVVVDYLTRTVTTESHGVPRRHGGFVVATDGWPMRWKSLPRGEYEVLVDRAPGTEPVRIEATLVGKGQP